MQRKFRLCHQKIPEFAEKTFANSHRTSKFGKLSPLKCFPLYSTHKAVQPTNQILCPLYLEQVYTRNYHSLVLHVVWPPYLPQKMVSEAVS